MSRTGGGAGGPRQTERTARFLAQVAGWMAVPGEAARIGQDRREKGDDFVLIPMTLRDRQASSGVRAVSSGVDGAPILEPGLGGPWRSREILRAPGIRPRPPSKPDTYSCPARCLLTDSLLSSLSRLGHVSAGSGGHLFICWGGFHISLVPAPAGTGTPTLSWLPSPGEQ